MLCFQFQLEENSRYSRCNTKHRFYSSRSWKSQQISVKASALMDELDLTLKLFPETAFEETQKPPNFEKIHKELLHSGITLRLKRQA